MQWIQSMLAKLSNVQINDISNGTEFNNYP